MSRITLTAYSGEHIHQIKLKDDVKLDAVMTKIEHNTPIRGVDVGSRDDAVLLPQNCSYIEFRED